MAKVWAAMTAFHSQQFDHSHCVHQKTGTGAHQISVTNCTAKLRSHIHEAGKIRCNNWQGTGQAYAAELKLYTTQALPLVTTRILRLATISPKVARSAARRPRDGCETSGKKSGVVSRACPRNGRTAVTAMPSSNCRDDSQDGLLCTGRERVTAASEACETARLTSQP